jgi:hypothetical protein
MISVAFIVVLALIISILAVFLIKKSEAIKKSKEDFASIESDYNEMYERYKGVINVETELHNRTTELNDLVAKLDNLGNEFALENAKLNRDFQNKRTVYESLLKEVSLLEENLEDISYGIYKPHCGLDKLKFAWGHDEYMYRFLVANNATIPREGLAMVRYHSAYPWHTHDAYEF